MIADPDELQQIQYVIWMTYTALVNHANANFQIFANRVGPFIAFVRSSITSCFNVLS